MSVVMRIVEDASGLTHDRDRQYLRSYDPDGGTPYGGAITVTADQRQALRFPDTLALLQCLRQQSTRYPLRTDGRPNRPLTSFTVAAITLEADE